MFAPMRPILAMAITLFLTLGCARQGTAQRADFPKPERPVADIVSPRWSADADRDRVNESGQIAQALGLKSGMSVADIGAGSGYHTFRLASVVGDTGRIYAEDIVPRYLDALEAEVRRRELKNIIVVRGGADDPKLPPGQLDAAIMVHMYHEIEQPYGLLYNLAAAFKPGGRLAIVDQNAATYAHGTPPVLLNCELAAVGYKQVSLIRLKDDNAYLAIFAPPRPEDLPKPSQIRACKG
jgi:SAM-dependent methyltransferase